MVKPKIWFFRICKALTFEIELKQTPGYTERYSFIYISERVNRNPILLYFGLGCVSIRETVSTVEKRFISDVRLASIQILAISHET